MWTLLASMDAPDGNGDFAFTGLDFSPYAMIQVVGVGLRSDTDGNHLFFQFTIGGTAQSGASDYRLAHHSLSSTPASTNGGDTSVGLLRQMHHTSTWAWGNASGQSISFTALLDVPDSTPLYKKIQTNCVWQGDTDTWVAGSVAMGFLQKNTDGIDGIRIYGNLGDLVSGHVRLLGAA